MAKQKKLPGVDDKKTIQEIEDSGEAYRKSRARIVSARTKMAEAREALTGLMRKHGVESYTDADGFTYQITIGKEKISVIEPGDSSESEADEAEIE